ncbi:Uncharacterized protein SCF082_LOCUS31366, partial [Durusdinium trenchii]
MEIESLPGNLFIEGAGHLSQLLAEARRLQKVWTVSGLDGTTFQLPMHETATVGDFSEAIVGRIGMKAGSKLALFAGGNLLKDFSKPLQQEVPEHSFEISYVFQQVCAL